MARPASMNPEPNVQQSSSSSTASAESATLMHLSVDKQDDFFAILSESASVQVLNLII